jgi:hypothetical protein
MKNNDMFGVTLIRKAQVFALIKKEWELFLYVEREWKEFLYEKE